jgi:16S rRNA (adenine1518-N6/adenine1519-N6)-dimethyltransferase
MLTGLSRRGRILEKLSELGVEPKRSLGQNFLISDHVVNKILSMVNVEPFTDLVEVGPGLGSLTDDLLTPEKPITLLEFDSQFVTYWRERAANGLPIKSVVECDALKLDWSTLHLLEGALLVSNLPYQISSGLVIERCLQPAGITRMILMFQKEVAQRLMAKCRSKEYGLLTVIAQNYWDIATVCDASPGDFLPSPNVSSRVLVFRRKPSLKRSMLDKSDTLTLLERDALGAPAALGAEEFLKFAKAGFSHRRKLLSKNLLQEYYRKGRSELLREIETVFAEKGLAKTARAEELEPRLFYELFEALSARISHGQ